MENHPLMLSTFVDSTPESRRETRSARSESESVNMKYTRQIKWPLIIIACQILLLAFSWGFLATVRSQGQIPLSHKSAKWLQENPQSKTFLITLLSTALSTFSFYLFSRAVRQAILVRLDNPTTISTLRLGISVSTKSFLHDLDNIDELIVTGVFSLAVLNQTAGWTSLLTPNDMTVYTPMHGTEIDFSSEAFLSQFPQVYGSLWDYLGSALLSVIDTSGATSATSLLGYPTVLDYAGSAFEGSTSTGSTGGIFPIVISANKTNFVAYYDSPLPSFYTSYNITMSQQGLTAAVSCQDRSGRLDATSDPPFQRIAIPAETVIGNDNQPTSYTAFSFKSACGGQSTTTFSYLSSTNDTVIALACPQNDTSGGYMNTYTVIIDSQGPKYQGMGTMVCNVSPQIQNMTSYYNWRFVSSETDSAYAPINLPLNSTFFYGALVEGIMYGQGTTRNAVGDVIESIRTDQIAGNQPVDYLTLWEAYIRGVVEFAGTAMKQRLAAPNGGLLQTQPPSNLDSMIKPINGTAITTAFGWQYKGAAGFAVLIPSTFVAICSILIVLFTEFRSRGVPVQHVGFDPSSPMALLAAGSAGGMGNTFDGLTEQHVKKARMNEVKLGQVDGKVGFVEVE